LAALMGRNGEQGECLAVEELQSIARGERPGILILTPR